MAAPRRRAETLSGLHLERDEVKLEPSAFNSVKQRPSDHQQSFELTQLHGTVVGVAERAIADFKSTSQGKVSLEQGQPGTHNDCPQKGWWCVQSDANQSRVSFSLIYGKIQGIFAKLGCFEFLARGICSKDSMLRMDFPKNCNRENFQPNRERKLPKREFLEDNVSVQGMHGCFRLRFC